MSAQFLLPNVLMQIHKNAFCLQTNANLHHAFEILIKLSPIYTANNSRIALYGP